MGAKGLGEHVLIPTAPAILNADPPCQRRPDHAAAGAAAPGAGGDPRGADMTDPLHDTRADTADGTLPGARIKAEKIRCDACPVMCYIAEGRAGACDRYANEGGRIVRCDPLTVLDRRHRRGRRDPALPQAPTGTAR